MDGIWYLIDADDPIQTTVSLVIVWRGFAYRHPVDGTIVHAFSQDGIIEYEDLSELINLSDIFG